jgi:glycosyltransferase involved in cell wall biosynthesis
MVRVVINGRFLVQVQTGVQRYARETLLALDQLLTQRSDLAQQLRCELAVPAGAVAPPLQNISVHVLPFLRGHVWEQVSLAWFARDAFLLNFSYSGPVFKRRQVITVHDAAVAVLPDTFSRAYRALHHLMLFALKSKAECVMTVSEFSRREIGYHFGVSREVIVGHNGWEHARAGENSLATPGSFGLEPGGYVLAVGSLKPNKNFALLGRALRLLGDFPLAVAIAGARDASVFQAAELPPGDVRMLGYVSDRALADLYRHAACFVLPSLYEGFGVPALEAMANGCPVLAARAGSIPEVCGDAALYFDPHNPASLARALRRITAEPGLSDELRANARARLDRYTWHSNAEIVASQLLRHAPRAEPKFVGTVGVQRRI